MAKKTQAHELVFPLQSSRKKKTPPISNPRGQQITMVEALHLAKEASAHGWYLLDYLAAGQGQWVPVFRHDCLIVKGNTPTLCPNADPAMPLDMLPHVESLYRDKNLLKPGQTIHWVGGKGNQLGKCQCTATDRKKQAAITLRAITTPPKRGRPKSEDHPDPDRRERVRRFRQLTADGLNREEAFRIVGIESSDLDTERKWESRHLGQK
jgi:hypothetical protein